MSNLSEQTETGPPANVDSLCPIFRSEHARPPAKGRDTRHKTSEKQARWSLLPARQNCCCARAVVGAHMMRNFGWRCGICTRDCPRRFYETLKDLPSFTRFKIIYRVFRPACINRTLTGCGPVEFRDLFVASLPARDSATCPAIEVPSQSLVRSSAHSGPASLHDTQDRRIGLPSAVHSVRRGS